MDNVKNQSNDHIEYLDLCPGCKSDAITVLKKPYERKVQVTEGDDMSVTTGVSGCESCGLTFLNPRMGQKTLQKYYLKQSRIPRVEVKDDEPLAQLMDIQCDFIEKFKPIKKDMKILEVGCAEGFFLQLLSKKNDVKLYGVELSKKYIEQAKRNIPDVVMFESMLEKTNFDVLKFDLIILRHVFEHLNDPQEALKKISTLLTSDGALYLEVPDCEDIDPSIAKHYHHEHLSYFTSPVLINHLKSNAFTPIVCERFRQNPIGSGMAYPVLRALSQNGESVSKGDFSSYAKKIYADNMKKEDTYLNSIIPPVKTRLHELNDNNLKIGVFGAGPHTMDLLELLEDDNIRWDKMFDNNPNKHGKFIHGIPIVKPDTESLNSVDCILFSSKEFEKEMFQQVHSLAGKQIETITLYGNYAI